MLFIHGCFGMLPFYSRMTSPNLIRTSKFLSLVLRHEPSAAAISLDPAGWVAVEELLAGCARVGRALSREALEEVVATNDKKRFEFSADGLRIRASQGHSLEVDLEYAPAVPPGRLYHGTATRFLEAIRAEGLRKQQRHHVHLSDRVETALAVGRRHGSPVVLQVRAAAMHGAGHVFHRSTNGVWLVEEVPPSFLEFS